MRARLQHQLADMQREVEPVMSDLGLDFFPQRFEIVTTQQMNVIAARDGFPTRYPHWRWGMAYEEYRTMEHHGALKFYELVINNDPSYAYMLDTNTLADHRTVMAHVYAHNDFFKNNKFFAETNREMLETMGNHEARIRRYAKLYGASKVERFIDACLSIDDLIDPHSVFIKRHQESSEKLLEHKGPERAPRAAKLPVEQDYLDEFINPPDVMLREQAKLDHEFRTSRDKFPPKPERDVMRFVMMNSAKLEPWQRDILSIIRDEAYYFAPQGMTKIMNEGWASYWHSEAMTKHFLPRHLDELVHYADMTSGVWRQGRQQLNPYRLGLKIFRDIEERWNKGQFGEEWEASTSREERRNWDKQLGLGREKIFEVRANCNDITFIDNYLTPELCAREKLFTFDDYGRGDTYISSREFREIKGNLLAGLVNGGRPILQVVDGNYDNRGELVLEHKDDGKELDNDYTQRTLHSLVRLWGRPVHVRSKIDDEWVLYTHDGKSMSVEAA